MCNSLKPREISNLDFTLIKNFNSVGVMSLCLLLWDTLYLWPSCSHVSAICHNISSDKTFTEMNIHIAVTKLKEMMQEPCYGYHGAEGIKISVFTHITLICWNFISIWFNQQWQKFHPFSTVWAPKLITTSPLLTTAHQVPSWHWWHGNISTNSVPNSTTGQRILDY